MSALLAVAAGTPRATGPTTAAGLMVTVVAMFPLYFRSANARFVAGTSSPEETAEALRRRTVWHRVRTGISCVAFAAATWCP